MTEVFISHSIQDKNTAQALRAYLKEKGYSCLAAPGNIAPGSAWASKQNEALSSMRVFVLVYSESSVSSAQMARELELAQGRADVSIIPYRSDDTPLSGSFEKYLAGSEWIKADAENNDMKHEEIYRRVCAVLGERKTAADVPQAEENAPAPAKRRIIRPSIAIIGCAFFLGLFAFGAWSYNKKDRTKDEKGNDFIYVPNASDKDTDNAGNVTVELFKGSFKGEYSGDTNADGVPDGVGEFSGTHSDTDGTDTLKYIGGFSNGAISGRGKIDLVYANGDKYIYEGDLTDGDYKGQGTQTYYYASGDQEKQMITGLWDGRYNIQNCVMTDYGRDGSVTEFCGEYKNNAPNGKATLTNTFKKGKIKKTVYEGTWDNGTLSGNVTKTDTYNNGDVKKYTGEYSDGKCNGTGVLTYTFAEGDITETTYEGTWSDDILTGNVVQTDKYAGGKVRVYKGEYTTFDYNGKGVMTITYPDGEVKEKTLEGIWSYGDLSGDVVQTYNYFNGDVKVYKGKYSSGSWNGAGVLTMTYASGEKKDKVTEGVWNDGKLSGKIKQTIRKTDGSTEVYEGEYSNENRNGAGVLTFTYESGNKKETVFEGVWKDGKLSGQMKRTNTYTDGSLRIYEGEYSDGEENGYGTMTRIDETGRKDVYEGTFENGSIKTGKEKFYDQTGELIFAVTYENGEVTGTDLGDRS